MNRKWDVSTKDLRKKCVDEVLARIDEQDGSEFGIIAANEIIDIILQNLGPDIYNLGIDDTKKRIQEKLADIEIDIDLLKTSN